MGNLLERFRKQTPYTSNSRWLERPPYPWPMESHRPFDRSTRNAEDNQNKNIPEEPNKYADNETQRIENSEEISKSDEKDEYRYKKSKVLQNVSKGVDKSEEKLLKTHLSKGESVKRAFSTDRYNGKKDAGSDSDECECKEKPQPPRTCTPVSKPVSPSKPPIQPPVCPIPKIEVPSSTSGGVPPDTMIGDYPAEYNAKVHGPYDPARFYGKPDTPFGQVKIRDLGSWFGRRNKHPQAGVALISRAYWRWQHKYCLAQKSTIAPILHVITASMFAMYLLNHFKIKHHYYYKYH